MSAVRVRSLDEQAARAKLERVLELDRVRVLSMVSTGLRLGLLAVHQPAIRPGREPRLRRMGL